MLFFRKDRTKARDQRPELNEGTRSGTNEVGGSPATVELGLLNRLFEGTHESTRRKKSYLAPTAGSLAESRMAVEGSSRQGTWLSFDHVMHKVRSPCCSTR
jgi:hypothetical protein